jgi:hypothetical protein
LISGSLISCPLNCITLPGFSSVSTSRDTGIETDPLCASQAAPSLACPDASSMAFRIGVVAVGEPPDE